MGTSSEKRKRAAAAELETLKARVDLVHIEGLQRTKDDFVTGALDDMFKVSTFQDLLEKSIEARLKLEKLGCFNNVAIVIDTSSGSKSTPGYGYDVTFRVVEVARLTGRLNTTIENNQGSAGVAGQTPNLFGRGETLQAEFKFGSKKMKTLNTSFMKPLSFNNGSFNSSIFKQTSENAASGYTLSEYGSIFGLAFLHGGKVNHEIRYEGIFRNAGVSNKNVAFAIRENSGYTLKSSIKNILSVDSRDSTVFPTKGGTLQLKSEFAGLGGNIGFLKNELFSQVNLPLGSDISLQASFGTGLLTETTKNKFYSVIDRFFLGGPLTLRGFHFNSVGPKVDGYATGGSIYWLGGLHLYTPLPHRPSKGSFGDSFRIHLFCNAGSLGNVSRNCNESFESLSKNIRLMYGLGLVYRLGQIARIELNYCIPILYQPDDKLINGVQLGLGVNFV